MTVLFSMCGGRTGLLSHFLRYYSSLGAAHFACLLYPDSDASEAATRLENEKIVPLTKQPLDTHAAAAEITQEAVKARVTVHVEPYVDVNDGYCGGTPEADGMNRLRLKYAQEDWYCVADLDEFCLFDNGRTLPQMASLAEAGGYEAVSGNLVDRVSLTGDLPEVLPGDRLDDKFPLEARVTQLSGAFCAKAPLAKAHVIITPGHHVVGAKSLHGVGVHHFKWTRGLLDRLALRHALLKERGAVWVNEPKSQMAMIVDGKLDLTRPGLDPKPAAQLGV